MRAALLLGLLLTQPAPAQGIHAPDAPAQAALSPGEVEAVRARRKAQLSEAEGFAEIVRRQVEAQRAAAEDLVRAARANQVKTGSDIAPRREGVDLDWMVSQAATLQSGGDDPQARHAPGLLVFVSFAMPDRALRETIREAASAGGAVIFRGMPENSPKVFRQRLLQVMREEQAGAVGVDPRLFRAFQIRHVPTFIVPATHYALCDGFDCADTPPPHDRLSGNVSVRHALDVMASGNGAGARIARVLLQRLKSGAPSDEGQP